MDSDDCKITHQPIIWFNQFNPDDVRFPDVHNQVALVKSLKQEKLSFEVDMTSLKQELLYLTVAHDNLLAKLQSAEEGNTNLRVVELNMSAELQAARKEVMDLKDKFHQQVLHHEQQLQILRGERDCAQMDHAILLEKHEALQVAHEHQVLEADDLRKAYSRMKQDEKKLQMQNQQLKLDLLDHTRLKFEVDDLTAANMKLSGEVCLLQQQSEQPQPGPINLSSSHEQCEHDHDLAIALELSLQQESGQEGSNTSSAADGDDDLGKAIAKSVDDFKMDAYRTLNALDSTNAILDSNQFWKFTMPNPQITIGLQTIVDDTVDSHRPLVPCVPRSEGSRHAWSHGFLSHEPRASGSIARPKAPPPPIAKAKSHPKAKAEAEGYKVCSRQ
jgi:hypothetical protein